jgi:hypothetical protein
VQHCLFKTSIISKQGSRLVGRWLVLPQKRVASKMELLLSCLQLRNKC